MKFINVVLPTMIVCMIKMAHSSINKVHFSNYRLGSNIMKYLSLVHVLSNNCTYFDKFSDLYFASSLNISTYPCVQILDGSSTSTETCSTSSDDLAVNCVTQHLIYHRSKDQHSHDNYTAMLLGKTPNYSNTIIYFTFVYNISVPASENNSITSIIPGIILPNYRNYLIPIGNNSASNFKFNNYSETMTQVTLYFPNSDYNLDSLWYRLFIDCDLFMTLEIVPSEIKSYLTALLTSNSDTQTFLYFDKNLQVQGYLCLDSSTYDESMNPLKLALYYKYNDNQQNASMSNILDTSYYDSDSISFSVRYGYDYIKSYSKFYFCHSIKVKKLMYEEYQTIQLRMISKNDYFTANNNIYDVNIINISDIQTLLCFVISTILESIVLVVALTKLSNLSNATGKKIYDICLTWVIFMNYFIISCYALYVHHLYSGNGHECNEYIYHNDSGRILDLNYQCIVPMSFILVNHLFELRMLLFEHCKKNNINIDTRCTCFENHCIESTINEKWAKFNVDIISLNAFACVVFVNYGKELMQNIDDYINCKSNEYIVDDWYCESPGERAERFGILYVTFLSFCGFMWINCCIMTSTTCNDDINHGLRKRTLKLRLLGLFVLFCLCFLFGVAAFYFANMNKMLHYNIYKIIYFSCSMIAIASFLIHVIKAILLMIGCIPRSIYTLIGLFFVLASIYLNNAVSNAHSAPYAPFIIILTPMVMITFMWGLNHYITQFKDSIVVIQSIFLQLLGMYFLNTSILHY